MTSGDLPSFSVPPLPAPPFGRTTDKTEQNRFNEDKCANLLCTTVAFPVLSDGVFMPGKAPFLNHCNEADPGQRSDSSGVVGVGGGEGWEGVGGQGRPRRTPSGLTNAGLRSPSGARPCAHISIRRDYRSEISERIKMKTFTMAYAACGSLSHEDSGEEENTAFVFTVA